MNMRLSFACVAAVVAACAFAQETEEDSADVTTDAEVVKEQQAKDDLRWFFTLPLCRRVHGSGEVLRPGETEWNPIEEGRFYPLGSSYRASRENSLVVIAFGKACTVTIENGASFSTRAQKLGVDSRTVVLTGGEVTISLPSNLKPGLFCVTTSAFTAFNLAGESKFVYTDKGDGFEADVRCVTGAIELEGRHYKVPAMRAADIVRIRSSHDDLTTILYGKSGDFVVRLDRGVVSVSEVQDDGTVKDVVQPASLDWHLSVDTRVQINRAVPSVGERLSVTMMTFDSAGQMKNHFAFTEGRFEVNTGELVVRPQSEAEEASKRAAEVTTEAAATETEEAAAETEESATNSDSDDF